MKDLKHRHTRTRCAICSKLATKTVDDADDAVLL